jgi:hypothetical protein
MSVVTCGGRGSPALLAVSARHESAGRELGFSPWGVREAGISWPRPLPGARPVLGDGLHSGLWVGRCVAREGRQKSRRLQRSSSASVESRINHHVVGAAREGRVSGEWITVASSRGSDKCLVLLISERMRRSSTGQVQGAATDTRRPAFFRRPNTAREGRSAWCMKSFVIGLGQE